MFNPIETARVLSAITVMAAKKQLVIDRKKNRAH